VLALGTPNEKRRLAQFSLVVFGGMLVAVVIAVLVAVLH
jgi:high-affinity Fe2+/Pb2+ permease